MKEERAAMIPLVLVYRALEAAKLLSVSEGTLRKLIVTGELGAFREGGAVKVPATAITEYVNRKMTQSKVAATP